MIIEVEQIALDLLDFDEVAVVKAAPGIVLGDHYALTHGNWQDVLPVNLKGFGLVERQGFVTCLR